MEEKWLADDEAWQRVVDNELSTDELRQLVAACERRPELWRRCALAFLEEQALRSELEQLASHWHTAAAPPQTQLAAAMSTATQTDGPLPERGPAGEFPVAEVSRDRPQRSTASVLNTLALAASLLLTFLLGWQASRRVAGTASTAARSSELTRADGVRGSSGAASAGQVPETPIVGVGTRRDSLNRPANGTNQALAGARLPATLPRDAVSTISVASGPTAGTPTAGTLAAGNPTVGAIQTAGMTTGQFVPLDRRLPRPLAELEQLGLVRIESTEGFVPVQLEDGNTAVVPIQQFDVRSLGSFY